MMAFSALSPQKAPAHPSKHGRVPPLYLVILLLQQSSFFIAKTYFPSVCLPPLDCDPPGGGNLFTVLALFSELRTVPGTQKVLCKSLMDERMNEQNISMDVWVWIGQISPPGPLRCAASLAIYPPTGAALQTSDKGPPCTT